MCVFILGAFFFFNYNYCHVNPERTESTELVRAVFMGSGWTLSNAQYLTHITVLFSFYDPFIYFKSNILSLRISFKIIATLRCLPQITILARLLLTLHWQLKTGCFPGLWRLSHPAGARWDSLGHGTVTPVGLGCTSPSIRLLSVCTEKHWEVYTFQEKNLNVLPCPFSIL